MVNPEEQSFVLVRFAARGSSDFTIQFVNVSPSQVLGACAILEVKAKDAFLVQEAQRLEAEQSKKLTVPEPKILVGK
jgi:hypothetical protein